MSYLAYELLPYWDAWVCLRAGAAAAYNSTNNQPTMDALVGDKESTVNAMMRVLLNPAVLWRELKQPVHSRFHRAREREMIYRLGVTGCGSRVALSLSEMLRGFTHATELVLKRQGFFWPSYHRLHNSNSHVAD